jgi:hypothetical protein
MRRAAWVASAQEVDTKCDSFCVVLMHEATVGGSA